MALGVLLESTDAAAAVEEGLVAVEGDGLGFLTAWGDVGLDGEEFLRRVRHGLGDGLVDELRVTEDGKRRGVRGRRSGAVELQQRREGGLQALFEAPLVRDALGRPP